MAELVRLRQLGPCAVVTRCAVGPPELVLLPEVLTVAPELVLLLQPGQW